MHLSSEHFRDSSSLSERPNQHSIGDRDSKEYRGEEANLALCAEHQINLWPLGHNDEVCRDIPPLWPTFLESPQADHWIKNDC